MMKRINILPVMILTALIGSLAVAPLAYADAKSECDTLRYRVGTLANACKNGFEGGTSACANYTTNTEKKACADGADAATKVQAVTPPANTGTNTTAPPAGGQQNNAGTGGVKGAAEKECGGTKTAIIGCKAEAGTGTIGALIKIAVQVLTVLIGVVAVGSLGYAGVLYASARDSQEQVKQAVAIARNVIIGLVMYGFSIAIVNWLVFGGVVA